MSETEIEQASDQELEYSPAEAGERIRREVLPTALEASAMFITAVATQDSPWADRALLMSLVGTTASVVSLRAKEGRGISEGGFTELAKTGLIGIAAAFTVDNPTVTMPVIENVGNAGVSAVQEHGTNVLKGVAIAGGLIVAGWTGAKVAAVAADAAARAYEHVKSSAVEASNHAISRMADKLHGAANKLHAKADKARLEQGLPVIPGENDFRNPDLWKSKLTRTVRPASNVTIHNFTIKK